MESTQKLSKFSVVRVRLNSQGYDVFGKYYGIGKPLYEYTADLGDFDTIGDVIRANDREDAKAKIRAIYPDAKFYY